jgi:hypothetical protein
MTDPGSSHRGGRTRGAAARALGRVVAVAAFTTAGPASGIVHAAAPADLWWNVAYSQRQKVTVTAGTIAVPTDYSVNLQIDHAALVAATLSLASGDDVRVVYWTGSGWLELDRRLDDQSSWNSATTRIWFRTQAGIGASSTDDNYYLYYGFSGAGSPPTNWANVFLFYDDFDDASFDTGRWSCEAPWTGSGQVCTEAAGSLSLQADSAVWATGAYAFGTDTRWESRLQMAGNLPPATLFYNYWGASDSVAFPTNPYDTDWITFWADTQHKWENANNANADGGAFSTGTPTAFHLYAFDREGNTSVRYWRDGTQVGLGNLAGRSERRSPRAVWNDSSDPNGIVLDWSACAVT